MKIYYVKLIVSIIYLIVNITAINVFSQAIIYQTDFENVSNNYLMRIDTSKTFDYWRTNDNSVQYTGYNTHFCRSNDQFRNAWVFSNNTSYGSNITYAISGISIGVSGLWGPTGLTFNEFGSGCGNFYSMSLLYGFWYDLPTDRWAYRQIPTTNHTGIQLAFDWKCGGTSASDSSEVSYGQAGYSTDGGSTWTWISTGGINNGHYFGQTTTQHATVTLPAECDKQSNFCIAFRFVIPSGSPQTYLPALIIDNVVLSGTPVPNCIYPTFTKQPISAWKCSPGSVSFSVDATGEGTISYQWQANNGTWANIADGGSHPAFSGSTTTTLNIDSALSSVSYRCIAINCSGNGVTSSNEATLQITSPANLVSVSSNKVKCAGDTANLNVSATGDSLTYQWFRNGTLINNETNSILTFNSVSEADSGDYKCRIENKCNTLFPQTHMQVKSLPAINNIVPSQTICEGFPVTFNIDASGNNLSYQWIKGSSNIQDATDKTFTIRIVNATDYDTYSCTVSNECGSVQLQTFILTVKSAPTSNTIFVKQIKYQNDSTTYTLSPGGSGPFNFQWLNSGVIINGATNSFFTINPITCADSGVYSCKIENSCDTITAKIAQLYVLSCSRFRHALSGYVKYYNKDSTAMTNTDVYLYNWGDSIIDNTTTDNTGHYVFVNLINGNYKLSCSTSKQWGGSNPVDALMANRNYIGLYSITEPLKRLAADVNNDKKINPIDALMINRRYIGLLKNFIINDWQFSNPGATIFGTDIYKNIYAICAGDINASYTPPPRISIHQLAVNNNRKIFFGNNKLIEIPVYLDYTGELGAIGIKLRMENAELKILDVKTELPGLIYNITDDGLNVAWAAEEYGFIINPDKPLFIMTAVCPQLSDYKMQYTSESLLADLGGNYISTGKLSVPGLESSKQIEDISLTCYPNPFNGITNISYTLPEDANVKLAIYNVLGEQIALLSNEIQNAGNHTAQFDGSSLKQGIYYCRIDTHNKYTTSSRTNILMIAR